MIGGAAGAFISDAGLDVKMDYDSLGEYAGVLGSGAVLVMDEHRDVFDILVSILHFFEHESCGKCSPCRIGTTILHKTAERINKGKGEKDDWKKMLDLSYNMKLTSFCPLGQSPVMPISSFEKYFKKDIENKINKGE